MNCEKLKEKIRSYNPQADLDFVQKAFDFSFSSHKNDRRLSGEPFIIHPLAVATILADLEQDTNTISAGLLHDTVEDTAVGREEIKKEFGPVVAKLVEGVTKLGQLTFVTREEKQAENFRKMFIAMGEDLRIIIIKLADRLHNMQTLKYLPPPKQKETALETREIFSPLAHRLGIWSLKWELEDLSFAYLEPDKYQEIKEKIGASRALREKFIEQFMQETRELLKKVKIKALITGRAKHFYSIYHKMVDQNLDFEEIYDLTAVRILVDNIKECYAVLGVLHAAWKPIPGRFKDYIAMPKSNGYQSLHTTVIGPSGRPVEVQIRTFEMHRVAEYGIAAHWRYKEGKTDNKLDLKITWLRQMLEWQSELKDAKQFMENLKIDLFTDEVFVFTPKGDVYDLQAEATPVDFAYRVHTEVGHRCLGAKINGRIVPLNTKLSNGDIIEIVTGKQDVPKLDWLNFIKTPAARAKIKSWFKKQRPGTSLERREQVLEKKALKPLPAVKIRRTGKTPVKVSGLTNVLIKFSKCCNPLPGEEIVGYVTRGRGVTIHCRDCRNLAKKGLQADKMVKVDWDKNVENVYPVEIEVEAFDRVGVLKDILGQIAETNTNVSAANISTKRGSSAILRLILDVKNLDQFNVAIKAIKSISDVYDVYRIE